MSEKFGVASESALVQPLRQRTLKSLIKAKGVAVHSGQHVEVTLRPAPPNTGVVFCRVDLDPAVTIAAHAKWVGDTRLSSCLIKDGVRIGTVEHLLSAVAGLGIDNLYIDINAPEVPIMDGSAAPWIFLFQSAGIEAQDASKSFLKVKKPLRVEGRGGRWVKLSPHDGFRVDFMIDFDHPVIRKSGQCARLDFSSSNYIKEISRARTFGFLSDVAMLQKNNLALGGSLDNTVVLDEYRVLNETGLRYDDEFVRHKMLDVVGDLYLLGHAILGHFEGCKSGHDLNHSLSMKLLADPDAYEVVRFERESDFPMAFHPVAFQLA